MKQKQQGLIFLSPDEMTLRVVQQPGDKVITEVKSGPLPVGRRRIADYASNLEAIVNNLEGFRRILADYAVKEVSFYGKLEDMQMSQARYIADQIDVRTGFAIKWLNNNQLVADTFSTLMSSLPEFSDLASKNLYVLTMGLNTATLGYFRHNKFQMSWNIDLGGARVSHLVDTLRQTTTNPSEIILDYISSKLEYLVPELRHVKKSKLLIQNIRTIADTFVNGNQQVAEIPREKLEERYNQVVDAPDQYIISNYDVNEQSVNWVLPNFLVISRVIRLLDAKSIYTTNITEIDGVTKVAFGDQQQINDMIRTSADNMARRYGADSAHNDFVVDVSLKLFDALQPIHRLGRHERLLLEIAGKIDDIGNFINPQGHYRHSAYILEANPLIGLSAKDNLIVAEVARFHSSESPDVHQPMFQRLDGGSQVIVGKLAAILRVADSLDDSRLQKISRVKLRLQNGRLLITVQATDNLVVEQWAFGRKNKVFKNVFGLQPVLIVEGA